jgi:hypothetical protein
MGSASPHPASSVTSTAETMFQVDGPTTAITRTWFSGRWLAGCWHHGTSQRSASVGVVGTVFMGRGFFPVKAPAEV